MKQRLASLIKYTASILIFLSCLLIPLASAFALGVTICGPKEALVSEKAGFSVSIACDATIKSIEWDFGDDVIKSGTSTSAFHSYNEVGKATVKVTVIVSYTDKEGNKKTDSGSDTHPITINAKLKLSAKPTIIPADGKSTTTITAEVLDYKGNTVPSYKYPLNLSSSNTSALKVPKTAKANSGIAAVKGTAGTAPDTVTVTVNGRYVRKDSCKVTVEEACVLSHLKAVDDKNPTRYSQKKLQMVPNPKKRTATITAYKENPELNWTTGEPVWTGIVTADGANRITASTTKTGTETAEAGGVEEDVIIEIVSDKETEIKVGASFKKFQDIFNSVASKIGGDKDTIKADIHGGCKWYKADQTESPLCQNTYKFSAGGGIGYSQKVYIPSLSVNFHFVKIGVFAEPDISLTLTGINIIKDGSLSPKVKNRFTKVGGKVILSGSISGGLGAEAHDPLKVIKVEADLKGTVSASGSFGVSTPGPKLTGEYSIGEITVSGMVKIKYRRRKKPLVEYKVSRTPWEGMGDEIDIDLSSYFNKN